MKQVTLKKLVLRDWKSLNITVEFSEHGVTCIQGRNGIGKSSVFHAWLWLLTGYTQPGSTKNADLYDHKQELSPETPEASVMAYLIDGNGQECTIERRARAKFVRKKGTNVYEKAPSDEYTLFVDNIETSVSMFEDTLRGIFSVPSSLLPYLLSGEFFALLSMNDVKKARTLLEDMTREISVDEMTDMDYTPLKEKLSKYTLEQLKEQCANTLMPLKEREHDIPIKIEEKQGLIASYRENDFVALSRDIDACKHEIEVIDHKMLDTKEGQEEELKKRNEAIKKRGDIMAQIDEKRREHEKAFQDEVDKVKAEITKVRGDRARAILLRDEMSKTITIKEGTQKMREEKAKALDKELQGLRETLTAIKLRSFDASSCVCEYCGQTLPEDKIEEMRVAFEAKKEKDREDNITNGKAKRAELDALMVDIDTANDVLLKLKAEYEAMPTMDDMTEIDLLEKKIEDMRMAHVAYEETNEYKELIKEREAIIIPELKEDKDKEDCINEKKVLMDKLESLNRKYGLLDEVQKMEKEISALENEKEEVGRHIVSIEKFQKLISTFEEEKARRVSEQINNNMEGCRIRMWRQQKDGQRVKDCIIMNGENVPYVTTNFSDRIFINIQLQRLFMEHYEVLLPTFVDEAYAFDSYHKPTGWREGQQMILLSPSDDNFMNVTYK